MLTAHDAYQRFLVTMNLDVWTDCLGRLEPGSGERVDARDGDRLVSGLCVAMYCHWLARMAGAKAHRRRAARSIERLSELVASLHRDSPTLRTAQGVGLILGWRGYKRLGLEHARRAGDVPPEIACILAPHGASSRAAFLEPCVPRGVADVFLPALQGYCSALLALGRATEVQERIAALNEIRSAGGSTGTNEDLLSLPAIVGLRAEVLEQRGDWLGALALYESSEWLPHKWRASLCRSIAFPDSRQRATSDPLFADAEVLETLGYFDSEIDQTELSRTSAFVEACRWSAADDWLVHFEFAKLGIRKKRRYLADAELLRAFATCPTSARFAITEARYANLTWLSKLSLSTDLSMSPEALECSLRAIECAPDTEAVHYILQWTARTTNDNSWLRPVIEDGHEPSLARGDAFARLQDTPRALENWRGCLGRGYAPRALFQLIKELYRGGFRSTANYLIDFVREESQSDFFVLHELAETLIDLLGRRREPPILDTGLTTHLRAVCDTLRELARFEFQHLLRLCDLFASMNQHHVVVELLTQAAQVTEVASEELAIAIARRKTGTASDRPSISYVAARLERAQRESQDRLERLQIAREYAHYGHTSRALALLEQEEAISRPDGLLPCEAVVVLQCHRCLSEQQAERVLKAAESTLLRDGANGTIKATRRFARRLQGSAVMADLPVSDALQALANAAEPSAGEGNPYAEEAGAGEKGPDWPSWRKAADNAKEDFDATLRALDRLTDGIESHTSDTLLALLYYLVDRVNGELERAADACPDASPEQTPRWVRRARASKLSGDERSKLWRALLIANTDQERLDQRQAIASKDEEDARLSDQWEQRRAEAARKAIGWGTELAERAVIVIAALETRDFGREWPMQPGIDECFRSDLESMRTLLRETVDRLAALARPEGAWETL